MASAKCSYGLPTLCYLRLTAQTSHDPEAVKQQLKKGDRAFGHRIFPKMLITAIANGKTGDEMPGLSLGKAENITANVTMNC